MSRFDGKTTRQRVKKWVIEELSTVDAPAHGRGARFAIMKRDDEAFEKRLALTTTDDGHSHTVVMQAAGPDGLAELRAGQTSWVDGHQHDWIRDEAGNILIAAADGHEHKLAAYIIKETAEEATPADNQPQEDTTMNEIEKKLAEIEAQNERLQAIVKLSAESRAHFDTLSGNAADEFLAKSADEQAQLCKRAEDADPVVYETMNGRQIRKSAGEDVVEMAKQLDAQTRETAALRAEQKHNALLKRAEGELAHLNGDVEAKAALLGAIDKVDESVRPAVLEMLKQSDAGVGAAMAELGTSDNGNTDDMSYDEVIDSIAKRIQSNDGSLTYEAAYVKALETREGKIAFAKSRGYQVEE